LIKNEECDDGNNDDGDGCSSSCIVETSTHACTGMIGAQSSCYLLCSDGTFNSSRGEQCDDGDIDDLDGCNSDCEIETGWECAPGSPSVC